MNNLEDFSFKIIDNGDYQIGRVKDIVEYYKKMMITMLKDENYDLEDLTCSMVMFSDLLHDIATDIELDDYKLIKVYEHPMSAYIYEILEEK